MSAAPLASISMLTQSHQVLKPKQPGRKVEGLGSRSFSGLLVIGGGSATNHDSPSGQLKVMNRDLTCSRAPKETLKKRRRVDGAQVQLMANWLTPGNSVFNDCLSQSVMGDGTL